MDFSLRRTMLMTIIAYILIPRMCSAANTCTCANGIAESGSACTTDGASMCASCSAGYTKNSAGTACEGEYVLIGTGWCRPEDPNERVNGRVKDGITTEAQCASHCTTLDSCVGYAYRVITASKFPGRCFLYGPGLDVGVDALADSASDWEAFSQPHSEIAGSSGADSITSCKVKTSTVNTAAANIECAERRKWTFGIIEWTSPSFTLNITASSGDFDCQTRTAIALAIDIAIFCVFVLAVCCCCCYCCSCCRCGTRREVREQYIRRPREVHIHHNHETPKNDHRSSARHNIDQSIPLPVAIPVSDSSQPLPEIQAV